jgi:hypothetical protein
MGSCYECATEAKYINYIPGCMPFLTCGKHRVLAGAQEALLNSPEGQRILRIREQMDAEFRSWFKK